MCEGNCPMKMRYEILTVQDIDLTEKKKLIQLFGPIPEMRKSHVLLHLRSVTT